jgi:hypothetical protein
MPIIIKLTGSALRRRCSADRRRQNHYVKDVEGRERALSVQRLVHNDLQATLGIVEANNTCHDHGTFSSSCEDGRTALLERVFAYHTLTNHCRLEHSACLQIVLSNRTQKKHANLKHYPTNNSIADFIHH